MNIYMWWLIIGTALMSVPAFILTCYVFSARDIFLTRVPEGEIIVVMYSGKKHRFMANITGYWVHPETGKISRDDDEANPKSAVKMPEDYWGIYWLGPWPIAERYRYEFHWNKWEKKDPATGKEAPEYSVIPRAEPVKSIYFRAQYPVQISGCETKENVPLTMTVLINIEVVNADTALFKVKSPGWLSALSGQVMAVVRDFVGKHEVLDITKLQAEIPEEVEKKPDTDESKIEVSEKKRSRFQELFFSLNESKKGNPSTEETYGVKIIAVSFPGFVIEEPKTKMHEAAIKKYTADREKEATITAAEARATAAVQDKEAKMREAEAAAYATRETGKAEAEAIAVKGDAQAEAARKMTLAVKDNPHAGVIAMASAIEKQKGASTLIVGQAVLPTKSI